MGTQNRPIRILHVVGGMERGGVEKWLMHVLRNIDRERYRMDFLVHTDENCAYDEEIRALGAKIIPCLGTRRPWIYARNFRRVMSEFGPYDVVHSHVHYYSGFVLRLAHKVGVPVRIVHSHSDTSKVDREADVLRRGYLALMVRWMRRHATAGLAASGQAATALFGPKFQADPRWRILYCGIDLSSFREEVDQRQVRLELSIPEEAFVIGHVGRFCQQKNHDFLVEIAGEVAKRKPETHLLLVGDGSLRRDIEQMVESRGLSGRVIFAGARVDVPRLMLGAMDCFLLPSFYEGLPLVGIEAQAAGLPIILSDVITDELVVTKGLVQAVNLQQPASVWANAVLDGGRRGSNKTNALAAVQKSLLSIDSSVAALQRVYDA
jgi:glycosyltransferase involved in cell wall biosynthesis